MHCFLIKLQGIIQDEWVGIAFPFKMEYQRPDLPSDLKQLKVQTKYPKQWGASHWALGKKERLSLRDRKQMR